MMILASTVLAVLLLQQQATTASDLPVSSRFLLDDLLDTTRSLQTSAQDVDFVCTEYERNSNGQFECECERTGRSDVQLDCAYTADLCNEDASSCLSQNVSIVVTSSGQTKGVRSCTYFTSGSALQQEGIIIPAEENQVPTAAPQADPKLDTCITLVPATPDVFNTSVSCEVTLNGQECRSCGFCPIEYGNTTTEDNVTVRDLENYNLTFSFDCCNIVPDIKQTCAYVGPRGGAVATFDPLPPPDQAPQCVGSAATMWRVYTKTVITTLLFAVTAMLI